MLAHTDLSLSEIALALWFSDQSHMTRQFRQIVGITPGQFRWSAALAIRVGKAADPSRRRLETTWTVADEQAPIKAVSLSTAAAYSTNSAPGPTQIRSGSTSKLSPKCYA